MREAKVQEDLIAALKRRPTDRKLWGEFYRRAWPHVYYAVYRRTRGDAIFAQDLAQDAFLIFMERARIGNLSSDRHAIGYLCRTAINLYRTSSRRKHRLMETTSDEAARAIETAYYDDHDRKQLKLDLEDLGRDLGDSDQRLLQNLIEGSTIDEIAASEGIEYGTAAVRLHRLKNKLIDKSRS